MPPISYAMVWVHKPSAGGAFVAVANDITAPMWNPAGLALQSGIHLGGSYENQFGGLVTSQYLGGTYGDDTWGGGGLWFNSELYSVYYLSAAVAVQSYSFGITGKLYSFTYNMQTAEGLGVDVGVLFSVAWKDLSLALGLVSRDIGWSAIHWRSVGERQVDNVAWVTRLGAAVTGKTDLGRLTGTIDFELAFRRPPRSEDEDYLAEAMELMLNLGGEVTFQGLTFRAGLADISFIEGLQVHPTLGVGVQVMGIAVDAAWVPNPLGVTYLLSAEFAF